MKRILKCLLLTLIITMSCVRTVSADMGPKPAVYITFSELEGRTYYVTLLGENEHYGPADGITEGKYPGEDEKGRKAFEALLEYSLNDEYYYYGWYETEKIDAEHDTYSWTYYPPDVFKVAIYSPEEDRLYVSETVSREAFYSYYEINGRNLNDLGNDRFIEDLKIVKEKSEFGKKFLNSLIPLIVTILVETFIAFLFGYREKKKLITVVIVNVITQLILNVILVTSDYYGGLLMWMFMFVIGEFIVFIIELLIYMFTIGRDRKGKSFLYALLANLASAALTFVAEMSYWAR